jgi:hypothetical protein
MLILGLILFAGGATLAQQVKYNYAAGTNFSKYKTYKWVPIEGAMHPDQLVDQQIVQAIDALLTAKGFTKTEAEDADLYVGYQGSVEQEKQLSAYGGGWRLGGGTATTTTIDVGTLGFDVYDPQTKQLVWRGLATKSLAPSKDPANQEPEEPREGGGQATEELPADGAGK